MKTPIKNKGLTLLELLIVISIVSILAVIAVPAMDSTMKTNSVRSLQRTFLSAFSFARGEAVSRNKLISICPSADEETCSDDPLDWSAGWIVFEDSAPGNSGNGRLDSGEIILRASKYSGSSTVSVMGESNGGNITSITWNYRGYTEDSNGDALRAYVVVCPKDDDVQFARGLTLERTGRVVLTRDAEGDDGIHEISFEEDVNILEGGNPSVVSEQVSCG